MQTLNSFPDIMNGHKVVYKKHNIQHTDKSDQAIYEAGPGGSSYICGTEASSADVFL